MSKLAAMSSSTTSIQARRAGSRGDAERRAGAPPATPNGAAGAPPATPNGAAGAPPATPDGAAGTPAATRNGAAIAPAFTAFVLAMLPAVLDQTVLATALPTIAGELGTIAD